MLIACVLLAAIIAFAFAAYGRVRHVLITTAGQRLQGASVALDVLFAQSMHVYDARLLGAASDPSVLEFLQTGQQAGAARRALATVWTSEPHSQGRIELRRPDGTVVLDTATGVFPAGSHWMEAVIDSAGAPVGAARVGPIVAIGDSSYYEAVAPISVRSATALTASSSETRRSQVLGYLVDFRRLSGQNVQAVRDLIGTHASMLVGSLATGAWSDLEHPVPSPGVSDTTDQPQQFTPQRGEASIGVATAVRGTPWVLLVEQPLSQILAPMQRLLDELLVLAALVIAGGAAGGWLVSRQFAQPIVALTGAAERLVAAEPSGDGAAARGTSDEVGRLADAFQRMSQRVREAIATETSARALAEATAAQLREHAIALEAQTQEARALATELEQQMEEAQAMSEELEQTNESLQRSVAEATAARADAEAANGAKAAFLASMSHELRTPLNAIAGYLDLLEAGVEGPVSDGQRAYLGRVKRAQGILLGRIDEVLTFAKVDSGTLTYAMSDIPIHELLSEVTALIEPLMAQRGLGLEYTRPAGTLLARGDREKCEQVILNLLSNAMKFTPSGGQVRLECSEMADWIGVSVSDTGIGIRAEKLHAIFEPFVQLDPSLTRSREGTGLGLAISRQLARGMGGELTVTSAVGAGSTFTLSLPGAGTNPPRTLSSMGFVARHSATSTS